MRAGSGAGAYSTKAEHIEILFSRLSQHVSTYVENENMSTAWHRTDQNTVQHLVVVITLGATHVSNLPFQIYKSIHNAFVIIL